MISCNIYNFTIAISSQLNKLLAICGLNRCFQLPRPGGTAITISDSGNTYQGFCSNTFTKEIRKSLSLQI